MSDFLKGLKEQNGLEFIKFYTLDANPAVHIMLFSFSPKWDDCYIGIYVNDNFHVLGIGSMSFINEDVKALYVRLKNRLDEDNLKFSCKDTFLIKQDKIDQITNKIKQIKGNSH